MTFRTDLATMGVTVRVGQLSVEELRQLADLDASTVEGQRLASRAAIAWAHRTSPPPPRWGKWDLLRWFASGERILTRDELEAALRQYRKEAA